MSPWRSFMRGFQRLGTWIATAAVTWVPCGSFVAKIANEIYAYGSSDLISRISIDDLLCYLQFGLPLTVTHVLVYCALITLTAPRFRTTGIGAFLGTVTATVVNLLPTWLLNGDNYVLHFTLAFGTGPAAFGLTWLFVRFKLDRAWFRFED